MRVRLDRRAAAAIAVAAALVGLAMAGGGYSDLAIGVATAAIWLTLIGATLLGRLRDDAPPALLAAAGCLLALLALTVLSLSWASSDGSAFVEAVRVAGYLGVLVLAGMIATPRNSPALLAGIVVAVVAVALVALGSRLLGLGSGDATLVAQLPSAAGRISYPVGYWNALGALMALGVPVLVWLASAAEGRALRRLALAGVAPLLLVAYMASSRGALLAAAVGIGVVVAFAPGRRLALSAALLAVAGAAPAVLVAGLATGIIDSPGDGTPGRAEAAVLVALALGMAAAGLAGERLAGPISRSRLFALRLPGRAWPAALLVAAAALVAAVGPSALIGDLRPGTAAPATQQRTVGIASASGTGRSQFWEAALDAFSEQPLRGIGAGGFETYWNEHGDLPLPTKNAHSEPLELLAELGIAGFLAMAGFLAVVIVAGIGRARRRVDPAAAVALGVVAAGLVGFSIDWTWQVPAVTVPVLVAAGVLVGGAGPSPRPARFRVPAAATGIAIVALGAASVWAAGVLGVATSRLDSGEDAFAAGHLDEAATAARSAIAVEPWAEDPWLLLARAEQSAGNDSAALSAVGEAVDRAPQDFRPWLLAGSVQDDLDDTGAGNNYRTRALSLYPLETLPE